MVTKILMVCLGNICRSPLAEGILRSKLPPQSFIIDSAGTGSWHVGHAPDLRSIKVARQNGIDISNLKGRQFSAIDFDNFDYIYVMDNQNYKDVINIAPNEEAINKVNLILNEIFPREKVDVPDPYYGSQNDFEKVYAMLNEACNVIAEKLR
jgi:protein-tyrosine phosphatase